MPVASSTPRRNPMKELPSRGTSTRRDVLTAGVMVATTAGLSAVAANAAPQRSTPGSQPRETSPGNTVTSKDGTKIFYKDWGVGPVVTFSHGWPLNADAWDGQLLFLAQHGFRVVAHDRRGHGRSSQASLGNDMDGYADDLAAVIETLDLREATLV